MKSFTSIATKIKGVTLVELMVTMAIVAIITTFAAPSMRSFYGKWQLSSALNNFTASLQLARSESVKRGRIVRMCRSTNGTSCTAASEGVIGWIVGWIVYTDNDNSGAGVTTGDEILLVQQKITGFDGITSNNASAFAFTPFGTLQNGVGAQGLTFNWDGGGVFKSGLCISFSGRFRITDEQASCAAGNGG